MVRTMNLGIIHFAVTFTITFVVTHDLWISGAVSLVAPLLYAATLFAHQRAWQKLFTGAAPAQKTTRVDYFNPQQGNICPGPPHCDHYHRRRRLHA